MEYFGCEEIGITGAFNGNKSGAKDEEDGHEEDFELLKEECRVEVDRRFKLKLFFITIKELGSMTSVFKE